MWVFSKTMVDISDVFIYHISGFKKENASKKWIVFMLKQLLFLYAKMCLYFHPSKNWSRTFKRLI